MAEFRVGDKVQVELPRGYSKRGVLGISVLYATSPEARFENAIGRITQINPRGPYSVHQYLVDFRPFDNSRLGIPWQAHWFREEWLTLLERATGEAPPPPPPTPPGPPVRAEDSEGPFHKGAEPGGDDRTPEQAADEAARLDPRSPAAAPPDSVDLPGPDGGERSRPREASTNNVDSDVAGTERAGDIRVAHPGEPANLAFDGPRFRESDRIGGDRVGTGAGPLGLRGEGALAAGADVDDYDIPAGASAFRGEPAGSGADPTAGDHPEIGAGLAGVTASGEALGIEATDDGGADIDELSPGPAEGIADLPGGTAFARSGGIEWSDDAGDGVITGGAVEQSDLGAATNASALAAPAPPSPDVSEQNGEPGFVRIGGDRNCPPGYPIKGNASSKIFHLPGQSSYDATVPEICFATTADALAAGYRPRKGASGARDAKGSFAELAEGGINHDEHEELAGQGDTGHFPSTELAAGGVALSTAGPAGKRTHDVRAIAGGQAAGGVDASTGAELDDAGEATGGGRPVSTPAVSPYDSDE